MQLDIGSEPTLRPAQVTCITMQWYMEPECYIVVKFQPKGPFRIYDLGGGGVFDPDGRSKTSPKISTPP